MENDNLTARDIAVVATVAAVLALLLLALANGYAAPWSSLGEAQQPAPKFQPATTDQEVTA